MSLLQTSAAFHPDVLAEHRRALAQDWRPSGRHTASPSERGARRWTDVLRLLDRHPRHRSERVTFGFGVFTTVAAQQSLRSSASPRSAAAAR